LTDTFERVIMRVLDLCNAALMLLLLGCGRLPPTPEQTGRSREALVSLDLTNNDIRYAASGFVDVHNGLSIQVTGHSMSSILGMVS
jgi:hypothetical protein